MRYVVLASVALLLGMPLLWALSTSLRPLEEAYRMDVSLLPSPPRWDNYAHALERLPVWRFAFNSLVISAAGVFGTLLSTSMAGYAFARMPWRGRSLCFVLVLATLVIPSQIYLIPHFLLFKYLGWINTYKPLIVPSFLAVDVFYVFLFRQFFKSIGPSRSLLEWARSQAGKQVNGFVNHQWNGVTTVHLAEVIDHIDSAELYAHGIHHIHSPDVVTKAELLEILDAVYGLDLTIRSVDAATACDRSMSSVLPLSATVATKPIRRQVEEMRAFFEAD